jgi:hypothetical protein
VGVTERGTIGLLGVTLDVGAGRFGRWLETSVGQALRALGELGTGVMTDRALGFVEGRGLEDVDLDPSFDFIASWLADAHS